MARVLKPESHANLDQNGFGCLRHVNVRIYIYSTMVHTSCVLAGTAEGGLRSRIFHGGFTESFFKKKGDGGNALLV